MTEPNLYLTLHQEIVNSTNYLIICIILGVLLSIILSVGISTLISMKIATYHQPKPLN